MKNKLYTLGASATALLCLTSFNPFTQQMRNANVEYSATYAATAAPAAAPAKPATPAAPATATNPPASKHHKKKDPSAAAAAQEQTVPKPLVADQSNLFLKAFDVTNPAWAVSKFGSEVEFTDADNKSFIVTDIKVKNATPSNTSGRVHVGDATTGSTTPTFVYTVCVMPTPGTAAGVCKGGCITIPKSCEDNKPLDFEALKKGDVTALRQLVSTATVIAADATATAKDDHDALVKKEQDCDYGKDYDKVVECAKNGYDDNYKDSKLRSKYAKLFNSALKKMAKDGDPEDIRDLKDSLDITSKDGDLYRSWLTAVKLSQAYQTRPVTDPYTGETTDMNTFEQYNFSLEQMTRVSQNKIMQYQDAGMYRLANMERQNLSRNINNLDKQYTSWLTTTFGGSRDSGPFPSRNSNLYGLDSSDYTAILDPYLSEASRYGSQRSLAQLYRLEGASGIGLGLNGLGDDRLSGGRSRLGPFAQNSSRLDSCYDNLDPRGGSGSCLDDQIMDRVGQQNLGSDLFLNNNNNRRFSNNTGNRSGGPFRNNNIDSDLDLI